MLAYYEISKLGFYGIMSLLTRRLLNITIDSVYGLYVVSDKYSFAKIYLYCELLAY